MNNAELVNIYIEKLINYTTELTKTNILQSAQMALLEKMNSEMSAHISELESALDKATKKNRKSESEV